MSEDPTTSDRLDVNLQRSRREAQRPSFQGREWREEGEKDAEGLL